MSIFGDIANQIGGVVGESLSPEMMGKINEALAANLSDQHLGDLLGHLTEAAASTIDGNISPEATQALHDFLDQVPNIGHEVDGVAHDALAGSPGDHPVVDAVPDSGHADAALDVQSSMEAFKGTMNHMSELLQHQHDSVDSVIQNLHTDAGSGEPVEVAVADSHDAGHAVHDATADSVHDADIAHHDDHVAMDHDDASASA